MGQPSIHQANASNIRKLLDSSDEVIRGLKALGREAESRDVWLIHILEEKLDNETRALWAQMSCEEDLPSLEFFFKFLLNRSDALESLKPEQPKRSTNTRTSKIYLATDTMHCPLCNIEHPLIECQKFKQLSVNERRQSVKADNRCFNCLRVNHPVFRCLSKIRCQTCGKKHHTLLHMENKDQQSVEGSEHPKTVIAHAHAVSINILPTAVVRVIDYMGVGHECRILLDSGSMSTFITENMCNRLRLQRHNNRTVVNGISGSGHQMTKGLVSLTLHSRADNSKHIDIQALVLAKLCSKLPTQSFKSKASNLDVFLADPNFNESQNIDLILGVQHVFDIMLTGRIRQGKHIIAVETIFGWILGGDLEIQPLNETSSNVTQVVSEQSRVENMLKQFWEIEAIPDIPKLTHEEELSEELFVKTTYRNSNGRFVVQLPIKQERRQLGSSMSLALSRQRSMERRFMKDPEFKTAYMEFMSLYHRLGHMVEVTDYEEAKKLNYLPHHGILKSSKFRVVFDASAKTSNGLSLNDLLLVGPTVQPTLYAILLRFRLNEIAISADVEKMYRQILVREDDRKYQAIIWRPSEKEPMKYYKLTTLTYGTAAAPYLATRVLNEIAFTYHHQSPAASNVLSKSTYVDDLMSGSTNLEEAIELKNHLIEILGSSGMKLRKWVSNSDKFLETIPAEDRVLSIKDLSQDGVTVKVLGLQ